MPNTVVMKFGGTSVGTTERISNVAKKVSRYIEKTGDRVVLVVSAMSGETDRLIGLCKEISGNDYPEREYNQLIVSGEQVSCSLTAIALEKEGRKSISMLAPHLPLRTKRVFGINLIDSIEVEKIKEYLDQGIVPVIAGFQGIDEQGRFTTLGRGGSDTTAVAIAGALGDCKCLICTDVNGVYTANPQICPKAKHLSKVTYEEMLELASSGAKVLQTRSVSVGHKFKVPLLVCSSFNDEVDITHSTEIVGEYKGMEDAVVSGISSSSKQAKITLRNVSDKPGNGAIIFRALAEAGVVVDEIIQSQVYEGATNLTFTVSMDIADSAFKVVSDVIKSEMPETTIDPIQSNLAKVSVVGEGMRTHSGVAYQVFDVLGKENINIEFVTTSEIKISVGIDQKYADTAVRALHKHFIESV